MWATNQIRVLLLLATISAVHAQSVTDADVERAKQSQPSITDEDIRRAQAKNRMPTDAELQKIPVPSTPRIDALPVPKTTAPPDLGAIAKGYQATVGSGTPDGLPSGPALLVFVSFAMPDATMERLAEQSARAHATLVLRGFVDGSLRETVKRIQALIGKRQLPFQIDPQAFDKYGINKTPTFVLLKDGAASHGCGTSSCMTSDAYAVTAGDVSVDYALEHIARSAPGFAPGAGIFLNRLRRQP